MSTFSPDPLEIQMIGGCELNSGGAIESFLRAAFQGKNFLTFKNYSCLPDPKAGTSAEKVCTLVSQYKGICDIVEILLYKTCPRYLLGVLEAGKADLQRQGKSHRVSLLTTTCNFQKRDSQR